jgi:hypothetical protein
MCARAAVVRVKKELHVRLDDVFDMCSLVCVACNHSVCVRRN